MPETIHQALGSETGLPVNSLAMLNELREILERNETNSFLTDLPDEDLREAKAFLWVINSQIYGQLATIDMQEEWRELAEF